MLKSNRSVFVEFHISADNGLWRIILKVFAMYGCGGHLGHLQKLSFPAAVIGILLARPW